MTQMSIGDDVYTTSDRVRFAVTFPNGELGEITVEIAPGETKSVTLPPNDKVVTIHRPLSTAQTAPLPSVSERDLLQLRKDLEGNLRALKKAQRRNERGRE